MDKPLLFALDIGTRSVVGLIGRQTSAGLEIVATEREEHHTRSMLDGQIHDVPEVAQVIRQIKARLEESCGPLHQVAVAAAGRSLCTVRAQAEFDASSRGPLSAQDERTLELTALQTAQRQLAISDSLPDPSSYYCVGYSVTGFSLDGTQMVSLVGQRGKAAAIDLIATFLPRQVIDSMQSALSAAGLELATMTLEPIAAINVLIPATMRHLNLVLVDVGAGTSDVAITRGGSVVAYGMVPSAGDEITEAISQHYLLDFNVAESIKRQLVKKKKVTFTDVLGTAHKVDSAEILEQIKTTIAELARDIANQILLLNGSAPQAVLLVGGGSLTPLLPQAVAQSLDIPLARVAIRKPETVEGICRIPAILAEPDGVTPLGILKIAATNTLHFITVRVNDNPVRLFNISELTVADALLAAGIDVRSLHGRPGLGLTLRVNGETRFLPGEAGEPGQIVLNGKSAKYTDTLMDNASIIVTKGKNGISPQACVADIVEALDPVAVTINQTLFHVGPIITVNGQTANQQTRLNDRDTVSYQLPTTVANVLASCGVEAKPILFEYVINGSDRQFWVTPSLLVNGEPAEFDSTVPANSQLEVNPPATPTIGEVLGLDPSAEEKLQLYFNGAACTLPAKRYTLTCDNQATQLQMIAPNYSSICYSVSLLPPTVSDVLLAADFNPRALPPGSQVVVLLNERLVEYVAPVKNGDKIDILVK